MAKKTSHDRSLFWGKGLLAVLFVTANGVARTTHGDDVLAVVADAADETSEAPGNTSRQATSVDPDSRRPIPSSAAVAQARKAVASIFEDKASKARSSSEWTAVAAEMFGVLASAKDPTERYALQIAALDVACKGNDPGLLFDVADSLIQEYQVERTDLLPPRLKRLSGPLSQEAWRRCSAKMKALVDSCLAESKFDEASDVITAYAAIGKRAQDPKAASEAVSFRKALAERRKAESRLSELLAQTKLPEADPKLFAELGRLYCFGRGDWAAGLPYLAKASDGKMAECAAMDLSAKTLEQKLATADAWARLAADSSQSDRQGCFDRAGFIYTQVLPGLSGLAKVRVEKAIDALTDASAVGKRDNASWVVVFRSADPAKWNTDSQLSQVDYAIPLSALPDTIRFVRLRRKNGDTVVMPVTTAILGSEWTGEVYGWQGAKRDYWNATPLGIFDKRENVLQENGKIAVYHSGEKSFTGWGFGHRITTPRKGERAQLCWDGVMVPLEPLEIAVTSRPLVAGDRRFLLQ